MSLGTYLEASWLSLASHPLLSIPTQDPSFFDIMRLSSLPDVNPTDFLHSFFSEKRSATIKAPLPQSGTFANDASGTVASQLYRIASASAVHSQESGVFTFSVAFPLIFIPASPLKVGSRTFSTPFFAPLGLSRMKAQFDFKEQSIIFEGLDDEASAIVVNRALLLYLQLKNGIETDGLYQDETPVTNPYYEINGLARFIFENLHQQPPPSFTKETKVMPMPTTRDLGSKPLLYMAGAIGSFPDSCHAAFRDLKAFEDGEPTAGPLRHYSFIKANPKRAEPPVAITFDSDLLQGTYPITHANPDQLAAVQSSIQSTIMMVQGESGTGKTTTLLNIVSEHLVLARRVLFVSRHFQTMAKVYEELTALGLDSLTILIADPDRDHHLAYKKLREQLRILPDLNRNDQLNPKLQQANLDVVNSYNSLLPLQNAYLHPLSKTMTVQDAVNQWVNLNSPANLTIDLAEENIDLKQIEQFGPVILSAIEKAEQIAFLTNPWRQAFGLDINSYNELGLEGIKRELRTLAAAAVTVDSTLAEDLLPIDPDLDFEGQAAKREKLVAQLEEMPGHASCRPYLNRWVGVPATGIESAHKQLNELQPNLQGLMTSLDSTLTERHEQRSISSDYTFEQAIESLKEYEKNSEKSFKLTLFKKATLSAKVLSDYGLPTEASQARRLRQWMEGYMVRQDLTRFCRRTLLEVSGEGLMPDVGIRQIMGDHDFIFNFLTAVKTDPYLRSLAEWVRMSIFDVNVAPGFISLLHHSVLRLRSIVGFDQVLLNSPIVDDAWKQEVRVQLYAGKPVAGYYEPLEESVESVEGLVQLQEDLRQLPPGLQSATLQFLEQQTKGFEAMDFLMKKGLKEAMNRHIREAASGIDSNEFSFFFNKLRETQSIRQHLCTQNILEYWQQKQVSRLKATFGADPLTALGEELEQRLRLTQKLVIAGDRVLKLKETIARGFDIPQGDPLFDVAPLWMTTPEAALALFPRQPMFDVVIIDDASLLETHEALTLMARGKKVVIAGNETGPAPWSRGLTTSSVKAPDKNAEPVPSFFNEIADLPIPIFKLLNRYRPAPLEWLEWYSGELTGNGMDFPAPRPVAKAEKWFKIVRCQQGKFDRGNSAEADAVITLIKDLKSDSKVTLGVLCLSGDQTVLIESTLKQESLRDTDFAEKLTALQESGRMWIRSFSQLPPSSVDHLVISTGFSADESGKVNGIAETLSGPQNGRKLLAYLSHFMTRLTLVTSIPSSYLNPPANAGISNDGLTLFLKTFHKFINQPPSKHLPDTPPLVKWLAKQLTSKHQLAVRTSIGSGKFKVDLAVLDPHDSITPLFGIQTGLAVTGEGAILWETERDALLKETGWKTMHVDTWNLVENSDACITSIVEMVKSLMAEAEMQRRF